MNKILQYLKKNPVSVLLVIIPIVIIAEFSHWNAIIIFGLSALSLIPLASYIGKSTEAIAVFTGPKIGGLLNATLGNAAELIITLVAINAGLLELVKASITGSIIGNLLLVLGMAMILGGAKNGIQRFDRRQASNYAILLTLSILALVVPSLFSHSIGNDGSVKVEVLSLGVAGVMIILYVLGMIYSFKGSGSPMSQHSTQDIEHAGLTLWQGIIMLVAATLGVVVISEFLVGAVEAVTEDLGLSEFFLGIILIPIVGNVAEHLVAVQVAIKNQMELSIEIAISSSLQIALFVAPILVFISLAMGNPLTLIFNQFELIALGGGVLIAALVSADGESNWLEGTALIAIYLILGLAFFLMPAG